MYETLTQVADRLMEETGVRFSDVAQLAATSAARIIEISQSQDISIEEAANFAVSTNQTVTVTQQKTNTPVVIKLSLEVLQPVLFLIREQLDMYQLKYTTYRAIKIRNRQYHKKVAGKKLTIAHKARHDKAKEVLQETNSNAEVQSALGITAKTLVHYLDSNFLY